MGQDVAATEPRVTQFERALVLLRSVLFHLLFLLLLLLFLFLLLLLLMFLLHLFPLLFFHFDSLLRIVHLHNLHIFSFSLAPPGAWPFSISLAEQTNETFFQFHAFYTNAISSLWAKKQ